MYSVVATGGIFIEPIPSKFGLYFENNGEIYISQSSWKVKVYRNLETSTFVNLKTVSNRTLTSDIATTTSFLNLNLERIENRILERNF